MTDEDREVTLSSRTGFNLDLLSGIAAGEKAKMEEILARIERRIVSSEKDIDALLKGFDALHAVTYVVDPELLLQLFDDYGYEKVEVLIGETLSAQYKELVAQKKMETIERLAERVEGGELRVYVPNHITVHSKLYILANRDFSRVIMGSLNLQPSRSRNYVWTVDLPHDHWFLKAILKDYRDHFQGCSLFMGDLMELFREHPNIERTELIRTWIEGEAVDTSEAELRTLLHDAALRSLDAATDEHVTFTLQLPEAPKAKRKLDNFIRALQPVQREGGYELSALDYLSHVERTIRVPPMKADLDRRQVVLCIRASVKVLTEPLADSLEVNEALGHIEDYLNTVDWGETGEPDFVKASMFEALLYMLTAPFFHEYMKIKRSRVGLVDRRGPRFLYIYGPSGNGKTTFLRFALKLLTGEDILPYTQDDLNKKRIQGILAHHTVFPLVFDDVDLSMRRGFQDIAKGYWEQWWREKYAQPQLILSSNSHKLKEWAKSRVKRVDFDVYFPPDDRHKESLSQLLAKPNRVFEWFSYSYMDHLADYLTDERGLGNDELELARVVMKELYEHACRPLPAWFPHKPIEEIYDPGRREWLELLRLKKATLRTDRDRVLAEFSKDMVQREVQEHISHLPPTIRFERKGSTVIIQPPEAFQQWLGMRRLPKRRFGMFGLKKN